MKQIIILILCLIVFPVFADSAIDQGKIAAQPCEACHGVDGNSVITMHPKLAGQNAKYLLAQMNDFAKGEKGPRYNAVMYPFSANLSTTDRENIAVYFASMTMSQGVCPPNDVALGRRIYLGGNANNHLPACAACHDPTGAGNADAGIPRLAGQWPDYTVMQLQAFKSGSRKNDPNQMMQMIADKMTQQEMQVVANYIAGLHA